MANIMPVDMSLKGTPPPPVPERPNLLRAIAWLEHQIVILSYFCVLISMVVATIDIFFNDVIMSNGIIIVLWGIAQALLVDGSFFVKWKKFGAKLVRKEYKSAWVIYFPLCMLLTFVAFLIGNVQQMASLMHITSLQAFGDLGISPAVISYTRSSLVIFLAICFALEDIIEKEGYHLKFEMWQAANAPDPVQVQPIPQQPMPQLVQNNNIQASVQVNRYSNGALPAVNAAPVQQALPAPAQQPDPLLQRSPARPLMAPVTPLAAPEVKPVPVTPAPVQRPVPAPVVAQEAPKPAEVKKPEPVAEVKKPEPAPVTVQEAPEVKPATVTPAPVQRPVPAPVVAQEAPKPAKVTPLFDENRRQRAHGPVIIGATQQEPVALFLPGSQARQSAALVLPPTKKSVSRPAAVIASNSAAPTKKPEPAPKKSPTPVKNAPKSQTEKLDLLRKLRAEHPDASNRKLGEMMGGASPTSIKNWLEML